MLRQKGITLYTRTMRQTVHRFDRRVTKAVVTLFGESSRPFFAFMTALGDPVTVLIGTLAIVGSGIYYSEERLVVMGLMIPLTVILGAALKILFERARPMTEYAMNMRLKTFSFPSGHSNGSMILFGIFAFMAFSLLPLPWQYVVGVACSAVPIFVGVSRVYLGAHFPSDVIAGWTLGLTSLALVIFVIRPFA